MVPRIAHAVFLLLIFSGFTAPKLPKGSKAVYKMQPPVLASHDGVHTYATQTGGAFSLTLGLRENDEANHRNKAERMLSRLERMLSRFDHHGADISVARVYSTTGELIINVQVKDPARTEEIRGRLLKWLSRYSEVAFVGTPGTVRIE